MIQDQSPLFRIFRSSFQDPAQVIQDSPRKLFRKRRRYRESVASRRVGDAHNPGHKASDVVSLAGATDGRS